MTTKLKTVNIKGKDYVQVNERIEYFRTDKKYEGWAMLTNIIELTDDKCVMKAEIRNAEGITIAEGVAYEMRSEGYINKTSYIENCETSAWGRALANLGIGINTSVASADEVHQAIDAESNIKKQLPIALLKIADAVSLEELTEIYNSYNILKGDKEFINALGARKQILKEQDEALKNN